MPNYSLVLKKLTQQSRRNIKRSLTFVLFVYLKREVTAGHEERERSCMGCFTLRTVTSAKPGLTEARRVGLSPGLPYVLQHRSLLAASP